LSNHKLIPNAAHVGSMFGETVKTISMTFDSGSRDIIDDIWK